MLAHPWALALLVPIGVLVGWQAWRRRPPGFGHAAVAALLALALAGPGLPGDRAARRVVLVLDASESVLATEGATADDLGDLAEEFRSRLDPQDSFAIVYAGREATLARDLAPAGEGPGTPPGRLLLDRDGTDLALALDLGRARLAGEPGDVFLVTDGRETRGDALPAAVRLAAAGARLHVARTGREPVGDRRVLSFTAPDPVEPDRSFLATAVVLAPEGGTLVGTLSRDGREIERRIFDAPAGLPVRVSFEVAGLERGSATPDMDAAAGNALLEFELRPAAGGADPIPENNRGAVRVRARISRPPLVLSARESPATARLISGARVVPPGSAPIEAADYRGIPLVAIEDVPAPALSAAAQDALAIAVRDLGMGLLVVGGRGAFGPGGYAGSRLEDALPVRSDPARREGEEIALVVCLDRSGSMGEKPPGGSATKLEIAKAAFARLVQRLDEGDAVALVPFAAAIDRESRIPAAGGLAPIRGPEDRRALVAALDFGAGGGTALGPPIADALASLAGATQKLRHVLVLSDGLTSEDLGWVEEEVARSGATLSVLLISGDPASPAAAALYRAAGGRMRLVKEIALLPEIFLQELEWKKEKLVLDEGVYPVRFLAAGEVFPAGAPAGEIPPLRGYIRTAARDEATVHMEAGDGDPLLATWRYGLGRAAAFASDPGTAWTEPWDAWPGENETWSALVAWLRAPAADAAVEARVFRRGERVELRVRTAPGRSPLVHPKARCDGEDVELVRVSPSEYRGEWLLSPGAAISSFRPVAVNEEGPAGPVVLAGEVVVVPFSPELEALGPDPAALAALAAAGGGEVADSTLPALARELPGRRAPRPLAGWTAFAALILFLILLARSRMK
ncbi:MAG: VWA domain-containing protein [Planctomycetes bacterium]|nr:VWA domain-containing protein [Planctomycetota bacterium]